MKIVCVKCKTKYLVDDSLVTKSVFKANCSKCNHSFIVHRSQAELETPIVISSEIPVLENKWEEANNCKVITVGNQKGGVGKTTTTLNLGLALSRLNKRVLVIDFDVQANLTLLLGYKDAESFFEYMDSGERDISKFVRATEQNLWLLPSNNKMALLSKRYLPSKRFGFILRDSISSIKKHFDYIIIDTPPSGDFYTLNSLLASDMAIIPTQCEYLSMSGVNHLQNMINIIDEKARHEINYKILVSMFDPENTASRVILNKFYEQYPGHILDTIVEKDQVVQESHILHRPVLDYRPNSKAAQSFTDLASELVFILGLSEQQRLQKTA